MIPFYVLLAVTLLLRALGAFADILQLDNWVNPLRGGLAAMFLLTASAHWGRRRPDLIRMVPPVFPRPDLIVSATGILEILGAMGLLYPPTAVPAGLCLAALVIAMFPANILAARQSLTIGGRPATPLPLRTILQMVFVAALLYTAVGPQPPDRIIIPDSVSPRSTGIKPVIPETLR